MRLKTGSYGSQSHLVVPNLHLLIPEKHTEGENYLEMTPWRVNFDAILPPSTASSFFGGGKCDRGFDDI